MFARANPPSAEKWPRRTTPSGNLSTPGVHRENKIAPHEGHHSGTNNSSKPRKITLCSFTRNRKFRLRLLWPQDIKEMSDSQLHLSARANKNMDSAKSAPEAKAPTVSKSFCQVLDLPSVRPVISEGLFIFGTPLTACMRLLRHVAASGRQHLQ